MPASSETCVLRKLPALEFLVGKHSLFVAAMGQSFFYLHLFKPHLPVWVAGPFFMIPWGIMFVLFYHEKPLISPRMLRGCWLFSVGSCAFFTVLAELIWLFGLVPPWAAANPIVSIVLLQVLMNSVWLGLIPMVHDFICNPHFWP